jgi:hypothetical protein
MSTSINWNAEAVAARKRMTDFLASLLVAARQIDLSATLIDGFALVPPTGKMTLTVFGKEYNVTQTSDPWLTPAEWISLYLPKPQVVTPPVVDPGPIQNVKFEEPVGSGNWYRYIIFDIKVSCPPPLGAVVIPVNVKIATRDFISRELRKQPPKSDEIVEFASTILSFMDKL